MKVYAKNTKIYKEIFNWLEIDAIDKKSACIIAENLGLSLTPEEVQIKSEWKKVKTYRVYNKYNEILFFIKEMWEFGTIKEILGLKLGSFLDPHMLPPNYLFGFHSMEKDQKKLASETVQATPFVVTITVPGVPVKKKDIEANAFMFGRQFVFCKWLSLYDCNERHFFLEPGGYLRRIDFGKAFSDLTRTYQGFDLFFPKSIYSNPEFKKGVEFQSQLSALRFDAVYDSFLEDIDKMTKLVQDDLYNLKTKQFKQDLIDYWKREGFLDENNRPKEDYKYLGL
jgi:hypothetical protein